MGPFNNREISTALWLLVFAILASCKPGIRKSLAGVLRAFCHFKILVPVVLMILYAVGLIAGLHAIGMWQISLLKDSITWFFFGAMAMMLRFVTADDTTHLFRKILTDSITVVIALEFLVNTYTFSLAVELVLIPVLSIIALINVVASLNKEHAIVANIAKGIETFAGLLIFAFVLRRAVSDLATLTALDTLRSIALAPLLSVLMFPFVYFMLVVSQYEQLLIRLNFGVEKPKSLKRYVRRRIIIHAGLSLRRLQYLRKNHLVDLIHIGGEQDVDRLLEEARRRVRDDQLETRDLGVRESMPNR